MKLASILASVTLMVVICCSGADKGRLEGHAFLTSELGRPLSDKAQIADIRLLNISFYVERDLIRFWAIELTRQRALIKDTVNKARPYSDRILKNQEILLKAAKEGTNMPEIEQQVAKDTETWKSIVAPLTNWNGATNFFANLPEPLERVTTDLSGKFAVSLPKKTPLLIVAHMETVMLNEKQSKKWVLRFNLKDREFADVMLTNDNTIESRSPDSVSLPTPRFIPRILGDSSKSILVDELEGP